MRLKMCFLTALLCVLALSHRNGVADANARMHCREPDMGSLSRGKHNQRKFLALSGSGAGIGNYLIFYPAAYYFAALTGREIVLQDGSLLAEMCGILQCGFPLFSEVAAAYPSLLDWDKMNHVKGAKVWDMQRHMNGEELLEQVLVRADGYKYASGWYESFNHTDECIQRLTGCSKGDVSCHDRHALQRLIRGPFKQAFSDIEESKIIGVPPNLKHAIMTLPHSYAPRLDAAVHLRCQFKHFEYLVGPEDTLWPQYVKEVDDWLYSTDFNSGVSLFKEVEAKIMEELHLIKKEKEEHSRRGRRLASSSSSSSDAVNVSAIEYDTEHSVYQGDGEHDKIYIYLASDNERVKEAFANYLIGHKHISVMRMHTNDHIVHAKNIGYLKTAGNATGLLNLALDWYAMSLSNVVFAWRRDTDLLSTFAQSSQRVSGNNDNIDKELHLDEDAPRRPAMTATTTTTTTTTLQEEEERQEAEQANHAAAGFQLVFHNNRAIWRNF